jgi:hypothetical protein
MDERENFERTEMKIRSKEMNTPLWVASHPPVERVEFASAQNNSPRRMFVLQHHPQSPNFRETQKARHCNAAGQTVITLSDYIRV